LAQIFFPSFPLTQREYVNIVPIFCTHKSNFIEIVRNHRMQEDSFPIELTGNYQFTDLQNQSKKRTGVYIRIMH